MIFSEFFNNLIPIEQSLVHAFQYILRNNPENILEVGSGWGIFARSAMQFTTGKLLTMDKTDGYGLPEFLKNMDGVDPARYMRVVADSHVYLKELQKEKIGFFDFVYVDGDHTLQGAQADMNDAWPLLKAGGQMMVDDVFHKENWRCFKHDEQEFGFGVTKSLWGVLQGFKNEIAKVEIIIEAHGVILITKK